MTTPITKQRTSKLLGMFAVLCPIHEFASARPEGLIDVWHEALESEADEDVDLNIWARVEWSKTTRGGRQFDLLAGSAEPTICASAYGLCE